MKKPYYPDLPLEKSDLNLNPFAQFATWFQEAQQQEEADPQAVTLATVNHAYEVSARIVLLKGFDEAGFVFFTNYQSAKAKALAEVPKAALVAWWPRCQRQVRITGTITRLDSTQSDAYFATRSKGSQLAALASHQSQPIANRSTLLETFDKLAADYAHQDKVPRPQEWGGYLLQPLTFEFWQGRLHRLHDRFFYQLVDHTWHIEQLSP